MSEEKKNNDFQVFKFDKVLLPQFVERINKAKGWVDFGVDNLFPKYVQSLFQKSPLHAFIIRKKARMIGGFGFSKINLSVKTMLFLKNACNEYDLDEILYRCAYDMEVYGGFALNIIWSKDRQSIAEINYIDAAKLRVQSPDEDHKYPQIENYWISDGWENTRKYEPVLYQGFSTRTKKRSNQVWYIKEKSIGQEYYAIPDYLSAIRWEELDWMIGDFHMNNVRNGMAPSYIVQWPIGNASDEEKAYLSARFKQEYTNSFNAGQIALSFVEDKDDVPTFTPIELNDSDGRFMVLNDQVTEKILQAHQAESPVLFGVETPGKLGGRNERLEALESFQNSYMTPKQNILENVFNRLARINGVTDNLVINRYSEEFRSIDTNIPDMLSILESTITSEQKYWMLVQNGYTHEIAAKLTQYEQGNQKNPSPSSPTQAQPKDSNMSFDKVWQTVKNSNPDYYMDEDGYLDIMEFEKSVKDELNIDHKEYLEFSNRKEIRSFKFKKEIVDMEDSNINLVESNLEQPMEWNEFQKFKSVELIKNN